MIIHIYPQLGCIWKHLRSTRGLIKRKKETPQAAFQVYWKVAHGVGFYDLDFEFTIFGCYGITQEKALFFPQTRFESFSPHPLPVQW